MNKISVARCSVCGKPFKEGNKVAVILNSPDALNQYIEFTIDKDFQKRWRKNERGADSFPITRWHVGCKE